jgi:hypothetical protein
MQAAIGNEFIDAGVDCLLFLNTGQWRKNFADDGNEYPIAIECDIDLRTGDLRLNSLNNFLFHCLLSGTFCPRFLSAFR